MSEPFGLYVHWPFCRSKCPYCDFNSHVRDAVDHARWREALLSELAHVAAMTGGRALASIFFGGGTPSLMEPETVAALIAAAARHWSFATDIEITLEANPTSVEREKFRALRQAGINRLSLGVQSLDEEALRFLGRQHSAGEAIAALDVARDTFQRVSFDLIYARPGQSQAAWSQELEAALLHAGEHISLYQLTIEPGTRFEQALARGDFAMPAEEDAAILYEATVAKLADHGLADYEISNFARPGSESRHNLVYWRYGDYAGIGPGAHGRLTLDGSRIATRQHRAPEAWLAMVEESGHATRQRDQITARQALEEMLMMGLRLAQGVELARIRDLTGKELGDWIEPAKIQLLIDGGFLELGVDHLRATAKGRRVLDSLLPRLLG